MSGRPAGRRGPAGSGHRSQWNLEVYRARHRLLKASDRERRRLCALFEREPILAAAWGLKETFRRIYRASDRAEAERLLEGFLTAVAHAHLDPFDAFAKGIL